MLLYSFALLIFTQFFGVFAQFFGVHSQKKTESIRLTGVRKDVFKVPVAVLDQCFPYQEEKSFGFEFQFPPSGGECKNGLTICYPSLLATQKLENEHFMDEASINSKLFNIDVDYNNYILKTCDDIVQERESITKYKSSVWHGISIKAIRDGEGELQMILDSSLIGQSYKILTIHRQFAIHFGTKNAISSYLTVDGGEPFHFDEEEGKFESFMELTNGSALLLKDFVGFWTLGMDILPWEGHKHMELYVKRSCECTLEAWFVRPTDVELTSSVFTDEKGKVRITQGPAKDYCNLSTDAVPKSISLDREQLMLVHLLTDQNIEGITFHLLEEDIQTIAFVFVTTHEFTYIEMKGKDPDKMKHTFLEKNNENRQIELVFAFTNYSYGIQINGRLLDDREFFPEEWWKGDYMNRSQNFKYELAGKFLLLHQPFVMDFTTIEVNYKSPFFALPFYHSEPGVKKESWATFHVEFFDPPENEFNISLLHDSPEHSEKVGATVMGMNVKPKDKRVDVIFWNCFKKLPGNKDSCDGTETKSYKNENLGKAAEFHIEVLNDSFSVIINGDQKKPLEYNSTLPVWATNFFRVEGNVRLLGRPLWKEWEVYGDEKGYFHNFSIPLKTLLNYGDQIILRTLIIGSETEFPQPFNITLLHEAAEWNEKIGDVILQMAFTFGDDSSPGKANQFICRNFIHERKEWKDLTKMPNRLNKFGQEFTMKITANTDRFDIEIETLATMEKIECKYPILDNVQIPPWAIDNIRFDGDEFRVIDFNISHPSPKALITNRINYIAQIKKEINTGNSISISLAFSTANKKHEKGQKSPLAVNLLNEGLSRHQKIGKTIIRLEFFPNGQIKDYYYTMEDKAEKWIPLCEQMEKWNATLQGIFIQITVTKESYDVKVNYKKCQTLHFNATLPPWALQYITIEFDEHQIDFSGADAQHGIECKPKNLCKMRQTDYDNYKTYLMEKEPESHPDIY